MRYPAAMPLPPELIHRLRDVRSVGAITGAGVSAESGIRPYRGQGGIYDDPDEGERTVEALSGHTLREDPDRTWRALAGLAEQARGAQPNAGHLALAAIERVVPRFVLLTQNVDGLHRRAGSRNIIDIHGDLSRVVCTGCGRTGTLTVEAIAALDAAPCCERCTSVLRPDAVLFGEMLPADKLARIQDEFHRGMPDLVLAVGTTALFPYIAAPVEMARAYRRLTVEINVETTALSEVFDVRLRGRAGEWLPEIARALGAT